MKTIKTLALLSILLLLPNIIEAKKCRRVDPIVGVYTIVIVPDLTHPEGVVWGNIQFEADHSFSGLDSGALGQASFVPPAVLATVDTGEWKRVSKNQYKAFFIQTVNALADTPPYTPVAFLSVELDITLNGDTINVTKALAKGYALNDPKLTTPIFQAVGSATGYRITFESLSN